MSGAAQVEQTGQIFAVETRNRPSSSVGCAVVGNIVRRNVDAGRTDHQCSSADSVMNRAAGAVVVGIAGETPWISWIVTGVGMGSPAEIKQATQVFALGARDCAGSRVGCGVVGNIIRSDVDSCRADNQCGSADDVTDG